MGITTHPDKRVFGAAGEEVQGAYAHPRRHTIGLHPLKAYQLLQAVLWLLTVWRPPLSAVERVVGKL
eukprot:3195003-Lingulodinium_polyedra.AAC.1